MWSYLKMCFLFFLICSNSFIFLLLTLLHVSGAQAEKEAVQFGCTRLLPAYGGACAQAEICVCVTCVCVGLLLSSPLRAPTWVFQSPTIADLSWVNASKYSTLMFSGSLGLNDQISSLLSKRRSLENGSESVLLSTWLACVPVNVFFANNLPFPAVCSQTPGALWEGRWCHRSFLGRKSTRGSLPMHSLIVSVSSDFSLVRFSTLSHWCFCPLNFILISAQHRETAALLIFLYFKAAAGFGKRQLFCV